MVDKLCVNTRDNCSITYNCSGVSTNSSKKIVRLLKRNWVTTARITSDYFDTVHVTFRQSYFIIKWVGFSVVDSYVDMIG